MPTSGRRPRLSEPGLRVLRLMLHDLSEPMYGLDLMDRTGVKSGTLYPLLARLAEAGWLTATREAVDPSAAGRPARTYYQLTGQGELGAREALAALAPARATTSAPSTIGWAAS